MARKGGNPNDGRHPDRPRRWRWGPPHRIAVLSRWHPPARRGASSAAASASPFEPPPAPGPRPAPRQAARPVRLEGRHHGRGTDLHGERTHPDRDRSRERPPGRRRARRRRAHPPM